MVFTPLIEEVLNGIVYCNEMGTHLAIFSGNGSALKVVSCTIGSCKYSEKQQEDVQFHDHPWVHAEQGERK